MKLLRGEPDSKLMEALAACVAHRCADHRDIPPLNMREGGGSSECGVCAGEVIGTRLAEQAVDLVMLPVLEGYADRLTHHSLLMDKLREVRDRLMLAGLRYDDVDAVLRGNQ